MLVAFVESWFLSVPSCRHWLMLSECPFLHLFVFLLTGSTCPGLGFCLTVSPSSLLGWPPLAWLLRPDHWGLLCPVRVTLAHRSWGCRAPGGLPDMLCSSLLLPSALGAPWLFLSLPGFSLDADLDPSLLFTYALMALCPPILIILSK